MTTPATSPAPAASEPTSRFAPNQQATIAATRHAAFEVYRLSHRLSHDLTDKERAIAMIKMDRAQKRLAAAVTAYQQATKGA